MLLIHCTLQEKMLLKTAAERVVHAPIEKTASFPGFIQGLASIDALASVPLGFSRGIREVFGATRGFGMIKPRYVDVGELKKSLAKPIRRGVNTIRLRLKYGGYSPIKIVPRATEIASETDGNVSVPGILRHTWGVRSVVQGVDEARKWRRTVADLKRPILKTVHKYPDKVLRKVPGLNRWTLTDKYPNLTEGPSSQLPVGHPLREKIMTHMLESVRESEKSEFQRIIERARQTWHDYQPSSSGG